MIKAMIVDDEIDIRHGLMKIIDWEKHGFVVAGQAANGVEALEVFKSERPALVVTDIRMPEMDGLTLAKELAGIERDVRIIILSGYNDFTYARQAMKYGVKSYLLKPVDTDEMGKELDAARLDILSRLEAKRNETEKAELLKNLFLYKIAHDRITGSVTSLDAEELGLKLEYGVLCAAAIEFGNSFENEADCSGNSQSNKKTAVKKNVKEILSSSMCGYLFEDAENRFGLLLGVQNAKEGGISFDSILAEISDCVRMYFGEDVLIGIGNIVKSADELNISFEQALKAIEERAGLQSKNIVYFRDAGAAGEKSKNSENMLDRVLQHIEEHYNEELSLKKLSDMFYINQFYLGKLIKKYRGMKFNDYLNNIRINHAKILLQDGSISIKEISDRMGYKNMDHFYKCFKEITGTSPGDFKQNL